MGLRSGGEQPHDEDESEFLQCRGHAIHVSIESDKISSEVRFLRSSPISRGRGRGGI